MNVVAGDARHIVTSIYTILVFGLVGVRAAAVV